MKTEHILVVVVAVVVWSMLCWKILKKKGQNKMML